MKIFTGKVISKKMLKTATVVVERMVVHPVYKKRIKRIKKYQVHDETGAEVGQVVKFMASKPYSKTKKWKITEIVKVVKGVRVSASNKKKGNTEGTEKKSENTEKKRTTKDAEKTENTKKAKGTNGKKKEDKK